MRQALKDELEFASQTTRQENCKRKEQLEERQGRVTVHGTFGGWQVSSIRERGKVRRQQEMKFQGESRTISPGVIQALGSLMGLQRNLIWGRFWRPHLHFNQTSSIFIYFILEA